MVDQSTPLTLWLTDRSRYRLGTGRCKAARYLNCYFGPTGYGITARADSLPLATGIHVHEGVEAFGRILQEHDRLPTEAETRVIIKAVQQKYFARVTERGYQGILAGPATDETIIEQSVLISGLLWVVRMRFLPWLHQSYRVVLVERERGHMLTCTCEAGIAAPLDVHAARGCAGMVLMLKNDLLAQHRQSSNLAYFEVKTTGWESDAWAEQWETDPQLAMGTIDLPQLYGKEVTELFIVGLSKGSRKKDRFAPEGEVVRRKQQSPLCYGYCKPGNPPLAPDQWLPAYEWLDEHGETRRASKAHKRRGVWELKDSDDPTWRAYQQQDPALLPEEYWVRLLPTSVLERICFILGPMNRQDYQIADVPENFIGEEAWWQQTLWELYELQQQHPWATSEFQARYNRLVPKSWNCRPFGKDAQCEFVGICHRHEGWQDPIGSGKYVPRLPHHSTEREQAIARGLIPEQAQEESDGEQQT